MAGGWLDDGWRMAGGWLEQSCSFVPELGLESAISLISSLKKKSIEFTRCLVAELEKTENLPNSNNVVKLSIVNYQCINLIKDLQEYFVILLLLVCY